MLYVDQIAFNKIVIFRSIYGEIAIGAAYDVIARTKEH